MEIHGCNVSEGEKNTPEVVKSNPREDITKKCHSDTMGSDHLKKVEIPQTGGSLLTIMEELIKVGRTMGYTLEGRMKNIEECRTLDITPLSQQ